MGDYNQFQIQLSRTRVGMFMVGLWFQLKHWEFINPMYTWRLSGMTNDELKHVVADLEFMVKKVSHDLSQDDTRPLP